MVFSSIYQAAQSPLTTHMKKKPHRPFLQGWMEEQLSLSWIL